MVFTAENSKGRGRPKRKSARISERSSADSAESSAESAAESSAEMTAATAEDISQLKDELEKLFTDKISSLESKITDLEAALQEKNKKVEAMEDRIKTLEAELRKTNEINNKKIQILEGELLKSNNDNMKLINYYNKIQASQDNLRILVDDQEQRGRKMSIRMEGLEFKNGETNDELIEKVVSTLNSFEAGIDKTDICRTHRTTRPKKDRDSPILVAQTIVRFRNWGARSRAYNAKHFSKANEKREQIACDLTKRRLELMKRAKSALGDKHPSAHVYANNECQLILKIRPLDLKLPFNTYAEFEAECAKIPPAVPAFLPPAISIFPTHDALEPLSTIAEMSEVSEDNVE